ncbi:MAG: electron transfer flavoprotein subunit alpha/FixB family protein [Bifidobacteriaceae bacterium]|jgi:electron transfer flavoprotein alpha subunit|nr:electron transfer flavoprotein subunit alpha/FixB family protein [Bifidobacteriaceae bacterium]
MSRSIWAWVESERGVAAEASLEVLGEARRLADKLKIRVVAVCPSAEPQAESLGPRGADVELAVLSPGLDRFTVEGALAAAAAAAKDYPPEAVLIAATARGSALAPRLAARFGWGYAPNSVMFEGDPAQGLEVRRAVLGGKADALLRFQPGSTTVVAFPPGLIGLDPPQPRRRSERVVSELDGADIGPASVAVLETIPADPATVSLDEAERIVAGGLGFAEREDWALLERTAAALAGSVGASKPVFDRGWVDQQRLIGQSSGRRLAPQLFVGVGVSGSTHFVEGMKDSASIVAINRDKGAPLAALAELTLVGDLYQILPELIRRIGGTDELNTAGAARPLEGDSS